MIRQRDFLQRNRTRVALLAVLGILALAVVVEHSGPEGAHMAAGELGETVSMCFGVLGAGAVALGAMALVRAVWPCRARFELVLGPAALLAAPAREPPPSRASPSVLQVFRC